MDPIKLKMLSNESKFLYALKELGAESGGLAFSDLKNVTNLSQNTVAKHLKELQTKKWITKTLITGKKRQNTIGYKITPEGIQKIDMELTMDPEQNWLITIPQRNSALDRLRMQDELSARNYNENKTYLVQVEDTFFNLLNNVLNILEFGEELGRINSIVAQIGNYCSKFSEEFFTLPPSHYLYLSVIFVFFNSLENPQFHLNDSQFIDLYGRSDENFKSKTDKLEQLKSSLTKKISDVSLVGELDMILAKQAQNKITHVYREENYLNSAYNNLEAQFSEQLEKSIKFDDRTEVRSPDPLSPIRYYREAYFEYYAAKHIILEKFTTALSLILQGNYGILHFLMNNEYYFFHERSTVGSFLNRKINDALTEQYINKKIFGILETETLVEIAEDITDEMETMHIIWGEIKNKFNDVVLQTLFKRSSAMGLRRSSEKDETFRLEEVRGFCPNCGNRILIDSNECEFCRKSFENENLIYDIKEAKRIGATYKSILFVESPRGNTSMFTKCTRCKSDVARSWTICPKCKHKLK
jgi:DNA-binding HxlR family transcriptional regulator